MYVLRISTSKDVENKIVIMIKRSWDVLIVWNDFPINSGPPTKYILYYNVSTF